MRLLCMNGHSSDLNEQMDSDFGFGCYRLDKDDIYRVDNNKSSCTLFMIEGDVNCRFGRKPRTTDCTGPDDVHSPKHENPDKGYDLFRMHSLVLEQEYEYL